MRYRMFSRMSLIALAAIFVSSCEEEATSPFDETAISENFAAEVRSIGPESPCPRYYYYQFTADRRGDDKYCARILEKCMGPDGRPRQGCV